MEKNKEIINNISNFSHAYLIKTNNLKESYPLVCDLAKKIICETNDELLYSNIEIESLIDDNNFDDFYVVNPETLTIKVEELNNLLDYFETKSVRNNGRRVYVIYGIERLKNDISNKLLKFIEEPENDIYGIIMTENVDLVLPTIISRCQMLTFTFDISYQIDDINNMKEFFKCFISYKLDTIAYYDKYFNIYDGDRSKYINCFSIIEMILSTYLNKVHNVNIDDNYYLEELSTFDVNKIVKMLEITSDLKS
jgi:DNA polymerase III delta prime subunit